jgi:hypothetical protein
LGGQHGLTQCWRQCAKEDGTCSFDGTKNVAYGANDRFFYKTATGSIGCNNSTFGDDPIRYVVKACYITQCDGADGADGVAGGTAAWWQYLPEGYTICAQEDRWCNFSGTKDVAYGATGRFIYKTATDLIRCNNSTFGGDPIPYTVKACYIIN